MHISMGDLYLMPLPLPRNNISSDKIHYAMASNISLQTLIACCLQICMAHIQYISRNMHTVFALLCFVVVIHWLIFPISIRLTSLALWQSNDCPSASKATLMNMDRYLMWIHYERLHNHNKAKHNKTVCISWDILYAQRTGSPVVHK